MRIVAERNLRRFSAKHRDCSSAMGVWIAKVKAARWDAMDDIVREYPKSADPVSADRVVFDIARNNYRIVAAVYFPAKILWVKFVGTHQEYDRIDAATIEWKG